MATAHYEWKPFRPISRSRRHFEIGPPDRLLADRETSALELTKNK